MADLTIKTNNHWTEPVGLWEVPEDVVKDQFDYADPDSMGFFQYRGEWYDTSEFFPIPDGFPGSMSKWSAYQSDSFFSGIVIRYSEDFEQIQVGAYLS